MRKYHYSYVVYKNDYPIYTASTVADIAHYIGWQTKSLEVRAAKHKALNPNLHKTYCYYDNDEGCYDYSQLYYKTHKCEIYRFWSSKK